jgi:hypothetical protein
VISNVFTTQLPVAWRAALSSASSIAHHLGVRTVNVVPGPARNIRLVLAGNAFHSTALGSVNSTRPIGVRMVGAT